MEEETRKVQRWLGIIRQCTPHRQAVASDRLCGRVLTPSERPLNLSNAFDVFLELGNAPFAFVTFRTWRL